MVVVLSKPTVKSFPSGQYRIVASAPHHDCFDGCASHRYYGAIACNRKD
jgi:hypothetical protein